MSTGQLERQLMKQLDLIGAKGRVAVSSNNITLQELVKTLRQSKRDYKILDSMINNKTIQQLPNEWRDIYNNANLLTQKRRNFIKRILLLVQKNIQDLSSRLQQIDSNITKQLQLQQLNNQWQSNFGPPKSLKRQRIIRSE